MIEAKTFQEWYAFFGGEEMSINRDDAAVVWEAATKAAESRFISHGNQSKPCCQAVKLLNKIHCLTWRCPVCHAEV
jgi:hypothetical protein